MVFMRVHLCDQASVALCTRSNEPFPSAIWLFVHVTDDSAHDYFLDDSPFVAHPSEIQLMLRLYQFGFEKAVILQHDTHDSGIHEVRFCESHGHFQDLHLASRIQKPWPAQQPCVLSAPMVQLPSSGEIPDCFLDLGISLDDLTSFFNTPWDLCQLTEELDLPDCSRAAFLQLGSETNFDRLVIYTDGSSHSGKLHRAPAFIEEHAVPDAWVFLVLGESYNHDSTSRLSLVGWMSNQVRYDQQNQWHLRARSINPLIAEREALTWAFIWLLMQNTNISTVFVTDSWTAKGQAEGTIGSKECDQSLQLLRGSFQALETALPTQHVQIHHVFGHLGDPWNEFVDYAAKSEAHSSFFRARPRIDFGRIKPMLPHLWLLFAQKFGAPTFVGSGFSVPPPRLPALHPETPESEVNAHACDIEFCLSFASANVCSLGRPDHGFQGKLDFLRSQFSEHHLNFVGIQESRAEEGSSCSNQVYRLSYGGDHGQLGVELWCILKCPYAFGHGQPLHFQKSHFNVALKDPRRMLIQVAAPHLHFWILVAHAPHSGRQCAERQAWWHSTQELIQDILRLDEPLVVCLDANALPGSCDHVHVFTPGFATTANTELLRSFMDDMNLCAPSTSHRHVGSIDTRTSPDGMH